MPAQDCRFETFVEIEHHRNIDKFSDAKIELFCQKEADKTSLLVQRTRNNSLKFPVGFLSKISSFKMYLRVLKAQNGAANILDAKVKGRRH